MCSAQINVHQAEMPDEPTEHPTSPVSSGARADAPTIYLPCGIRFFKVSTSLLGAWPLVIHFSVVSDQSG
jgi:hypothetical protein